MALKSMTGFAASSGHVEGADWRWDVRTLNGRGLDVRVRLPQGFEDAEPKAREAISKALARGNCQATLQVRRLETQGQLSINENALERVIAMLDRVREATGSKAPRADGILALKGVLELTEPDDGEETRQTRLEHVLGGLDEALAALGLTRAREGAELQKVVSEHINQIEKLVADVSALPARTREAQMERLRAQLDRLLDTGIELSAERLYQEAALIATKADVREELDRLSAHVEAARTLFKLDEPVGRRLDFLAQELNREANTICAKSNDIETSRLGLELKAVIDQLREQVQNIE